MKILHLCLSAFFVDGYSYQENILAKYHVKFGFDVTVIASLFSFDKDGKGTYLPEPKKYRDKDGFNVIRLSYKKPTRWNRIFRHYDGLEKCIEDISPDIIFIHNASFGDTPIIKEFIQSHPNVRLYADSHVDYINSAKNWLSFHILHSLVWRYYIKILEPYYKKVYGVTPMRCRFLSEMYHLRDDIIEYLPLGVDDDNIPLDRKSVRERVRKELGIVDEDQLIISGGKIDKLKNTHILLNALKHLHDARIHIVICGVLTPEMEYLNQEIESNLNIHYLGWCNAERVMDCMIAADIACFPGTHSTLWEQSVGVGLPAVFKRWPEMEHVNVSNNCIFVKGEDEVEIASAIKTILNNYKTFSNCAKEASKKFLYSNISKKAIEL